MEPLMQFFDTALANETHARWIFVALIAAAVMAFSVAVSNLIGSIGTPYRQRVRFLTGSGEGKGRLGTRRSMLDSLDPITDHFIPSKDAATSPVRMKLMHAGYRSKRALKNFYTLKFVLLIASLVLFAGAYLLIPEMTGRQSVFAMLGVVFVAFILPSYILDKMAAKRIRTLHNSFPDALDLLIVCVEAGLGLTAALQRVAQELDVNHPELAEELNLVNAEIRAGVHRIDALKAMAERTGVDDIKGLVALLDQSMRFGGSIANTLRVYSEEFRDKRMQKAEEMASKVGTKMIFPLTFCLWPGFFLVAVGPAVLRVMEALGR